MAGAAVDRLIPIEVLAASPEELQRAFEPLVLKSNDWSDDDQLRDGIYESAQPFHTDLIASLASNPRFDDGAYRALAVINSAESRAHLRRLYDEASDLRARSRIVYELSAVLDPDSVDFLASLLPGRHTTHDEAIKSHAVRGLQCIGTEAARDAIVNGVTQWSDQTERLEVLRSVSSRRAVDAIVALRLGDDDQLFMSACSALQGLTHYQWCDHEQLLSALYPHRNETRVRNTVTAAQARWSRWWARNRNNVRIYGGDTELRQPLPKIW